MVEIILISLQAQYKDIWQHLLLLRKHVTNLSCEDTSTESTRTEYIHIGVLCLAEIRMRRADQGQTTAHQAAQHWQYTCVPYGFLIVGDVHISGEGSIVLSDTLLTLWQILLAPHDALMTEDPFPKALQRQTPWNGLKPLRTRACCYNPETVSITNDPFYHTGIHVLWNMIQLNSNAGLEIAARTQQVAKKQHHRFKTRSCISHFSFIQ